MKVHFWMHPLGDSSQVRALLRARLGEGALDLAAHFLAGPTPGFSRSPGPTAPGQPCDRPWEVACTTADALGECKSPRAPSRSVMEPAGLNKL